MKIVKRKLLLTSLAFSLMQSGLGAAKLTETKESAPLPTAKTLLNAVRFAGCASIAFFTLGQASYHLGNLLAGNWLEKNFDGTSGYKQGIRFGVGMVGTSILLGFVNCMDHFGYSTIAEGIQDGQNATEDSIDDTAPAKTKTMATTAEAA